MTILVFSMFLAALSTCLVMGWPVMKCRAIVMPTPSSTTRKASRLSPTPPLLRLEKKPGPT